MKDEEQQIEKIVKQLELLPSEAKRAVCWLVDNINLIEQIVDGDKIPELKMEEYIKDARNRKDYIMSNYGIYAKKRPN